MKRKMIILVACLALLWVQNAIADPTDVSGQDLIESIAALYDECGDYKVWPAEEYQKAASMLHDAGIIGDADLQSISSQSPDVMGDSLLNLLPGVSSKFIKRVAISVWGDEDFWTLENAYGYTEMLRNHQLLSENDKIYMLPEGKTTAVENLVQRAIAYIKQQYNVDCSDAVFFSTYYAPQISETPRWKIVFCTQDTLKKLSTIELDEAGDILSCSMYQESDKEQDVVGYIFKLSLEEQAEYAQQFTTPMYGFPDSTHIQEEAAKELAHAALEDNGIHYESDQLNEYVSFIIAGSEPGTYPYWEVSYTDVQTGLFQYSVQLSAVTGEILNVHIEDWTIPGKG